MEVLMRRLATATVVLVTAFAAGASAGSLPKASRLVDRMKAYELTHYVRGASPGKGGGGSRTTVEARRPTVSPQQAATKPPLPVRAD
jgi:hypothetical protein